MPTIEHKDTKSEKRRRTARNIETFEVRFSNVGGDRATWTERIARPVNELAIVTAVRRKGVVLSDDLSAPYVHDYGGTIYAGMHAIGTYAIVPGSSRLERAK